MRAPRRTFSGHPQMGPPPPGTGRGERAWEGVWELYLSVGDRVFCCVAVHSGSRGDNASHQRPVPTHSSLIHPSQWRQGTSPCPP